MHDSFIENSPLGIATANLEGKFVSANNSFLDLVGYTMDELKELTYLDLTHPDDRNQSIEYLEKMFKRDSTLELFEKRYIKKDGQIIYVKITTWLLKDKDGNLTNHVGVFEDVTEKKAMEEKIQASEKQHRMLIENMNDGLIETNERDEIRFVNERFCEMLGYSREELLGKSPSVFLEESNKKIFEEKDHLRRKGLEEQHELTWQKPDGELVPTLISPKSFLDENGAFTGAFAVVTDISELKKAEAKLRDSEKFYKAIFENTGTASIIVEEDHTISLVNSQFEKLSGYSSEEIVRKKSWTEFVAKEDLERMRKYHSERRKEGISAPTSYEFRFTDREGTTKNVFLSVDLIPGTNQTTASLLDITKIKEIENSLEESNMKYRTIFDEANDMMVLHSLVRGTSESSIFDVNKQLCLRLGYSKEELLTMTTFDIDSESTLKNITKIRESYTEQGHGTFEIEFRTKEGEIVPVEMSSHIMKIGDEEVVLSTARDISERKRFEAELQGKAQELRLYLDILTHDVKNYQVSVVGYLDLALCYEHSLDAEKFIKKAQANVSNTENLLHNASIIMMLKEPSVDTLKPLKLSKIVNEAKEYTIDQFPHKTIEIDVSKIDKDTSVVVDHLCQQLFVNLFSNGIKFTTQEDVKIDVYQEKSTKGKCSVVVADNAKGIHMDEREKIFERYSEFKRRGKGSGLGLYITQTLVKRYDGRIWIESKVDEDYTKGTKFIVEFNTK